MRRTKEDAARTREAVLRAALAVFGLMERDRQLRSMMELALFKTELNDETRPGHRRRVQAATP